MAAGRKTGGRLKGTPNKLTRDVAECLASLACDPITGMAQIAKNPKNTPELRLRAYAELAAYCYPKRKAVEIRADENKGDFTLQELLATYRGMTSGR